jgi:hypothetical protein
VLASLMSLHRGVAWFTCMQNEGALRMLGKCSTKCHLKMHGLLDHHDIGTYEMLARSEVTATTSTNVAGVCATKLCYFCGGVLNALAV